GSGLPDWTVIAAGTFLFLLPVAIFTFLLRNHLLRGMSFGAIRK
ncbi:MAG: carbohydrate ABC transporter permease, partial [Mesorhizobium sp.]